MISISSCLTGKNSCRGGSNKRIVTGKPFIASKIPTKSDFWYGNSLSSDAFLSSTFFARIIFLTFLILLSSKNICSVLVKPIPSAPNDLAFAASFGLSALVRTFSFLNSSDHCINVSKLPESCGSIFLISPIYTLPAVPSIEMISPSLISKPLCALIIFLASSTLSSEQPATQHLPIPLATTAAWDVIPPLAVKMPSARTIPSISSGEVSSRTRIVAIPFSCISFTASGQNTTAPLAAPGEAGKPFVTNVLSFKSDSSNW